MSILLHFALISISICHVRSNKLIHLPTIVHPYCSHDDYLDPAPQSYEALPYCYKFSDLQTSQSSPVDVIKRILNNEALIGKPEPALIAPFYLQQNEFANSVHQALERVSVMCILLL